MNLNEYITYSNLQNIMKAILRGKFIALSTYIKQLERYQSDNLPAFLKAPAEAITAKEIGGKE